MNGIDEGSSGRTSESRGEESYPIPFRDVWDAAIAIIGKLPEWSVDERDSRAGELRITSADRFGRDPFPGVVRLWLDEMGQTRLEIRLEQPSRLLRGGSGGRRVRRFLTRLHASLVRSPAP